MNLIWKMRAGARTEWKGNLDKVVQQNCHSDLQQYLLTFIQVFELDKSLSARRFHSNAMCLPELSAGSIYTKSNLTIS